MNTHEKRVAALLEYEIMDSPPEQAFDDLTKLTSFICGTPIALITLLDHERQWFKSSFGLSATETPLGHAFCAHAIEQSGIFTVPDATRDTRFSANPLVTGDPNIRFYAGSPLVNKDGVALGTLCAIDRVPRTLTRGQEEALAALGRNVMQLIEMRKYAWNLSKALAGKQAAEREVAALQELLPMCAWCRKLRDEKSFWHSVESYLEAHGNKQITHGICPDCLAKIEKKLPPQAHTS